jgi:hypothetical protein
MNITGSFNGDQLYDHNFNGEYPDYGPVATGAFSVGGSTTKRTASSSPDEKQKGFSFDASKSWSGSTSSAGNHQHSVTIPATSMTVGNNSASHTHSVSLTIPSQTVNVASYTHNHSVTVGNTGGGSAFSIIPSYYAVYIWRRTA